jgi:integrase
VTDTHLKKVINKSEAQKGSTNASALSWNLSDHQLLRKTINKARELSFKNARCPFLVSYKPQRNYNTKGEVKTHHFQVLPNFLTLQFRIIRNRLYQLGKIDEAASTTTFHEIRSLASHLLEKAGEDITDVQTLMAHSDPKMTKQYQAGHEQEFTEIKISLNENFLKNN